MKKKVVPTLRQEVTVKVDIVTSDDIKIYYTGKCQDFTARYIINIGYIYIFFFFGERSKFISCFPVGYREISVKIFDLTLVPPVKIPIFTFLLPSLIARASQPDGNMTSFTLHFSRLTQYCNCVAMRKGYATGNNGKELYWILIKLLPERVKSMKLTEYLVFFFR